jgi:hypothetical protein
MKKKNKITRMIIVLLAFASVARGQPADWRNIANGYPIYQNGYIDQPYVVVLKDGRWLCVFTTGAGTESAAGQYIAATVTADKGRSWSRPVAIEPPDGPAASWATPYITASGRVYVFYDYNGENVQTLNGKPIQHNSELGWYCYKYSDDDGLTWSDRYRLPLPKAPVDLRNDFKGEVQLFWGIDKPKKMGNSLFMAFTRLGKYIQSDGEGWFYKADNIEREKDPQKLHWDLLPEGNQGVRNPAYDSIQEEFNTVPMNNGDIFCMYRTTMGYAACTYSRDQGRTWTLPVAAPYAPGGAQVLKTPRACPRVFKCSNGKYLFWFHNHGGRNYLGRNPVWISGGVEKNGFIYWSQPEILLYDKDTTILGMSYPDLVEQDGHFWVTETQKTKARVHPVDKGLLEGMWKQFEPGTPAKAGLVFDRSNISNNKVYTIPPLTGLRDHGFTIDLWVTFQALDPGETLLDSRDRAGKGIWISTAAQEAVNLYVSDGSRTANWNSDAGLLKKDTLHHIAFTVDGAANIITVVVDGRLCDGGKDRQYGWGRISEELVDINGNTQWRLAPDLKGKIRRLRVYDRNLTTSECVGNFRAGPR